MAHLDAVPALSDVERELARTGLRLRFRSMALEAMYQAEARLAGRLHNRLIMLIFVVLVDLFYVPLHALEPEIATLAAIQRFGVLTPLWAIYAYMDWRGRLGGWSQAVAASLPALALLMMANEIIRTTSPNTAADIAATPLIQMVIVCARLNVRQATCIMLVASTSYILAITHCRAVPHFMLSDMILTSLAIGCCQLAFAVRVDVRERQVFLLGRQAMENSASLAEKNRALAQMLDIDPLTGVGNRRCFDVAMRSAWRSMGPEYYLSLVLVDIDHFKCYNDTLGHPAGDVCLRKVAEILAGCVRTRDDTVARYGGEEFALILPDTRLSDAIFVAERVRDAVVAAAIPHPGAAGLNILTVSVGAACMRPDSGSYELLISDADGHLYNAKRQGRNRVATEWYPQTAG